MPVHSRFYLLVTHNQLFVSTDTLVKYLVWFADLSIDMLAEKIAADIINSKQEWADE